VTRNEVAAVETDETLAQTAKTAPHYDNLRLQSGRKVLAPHLALNRAESAEAELDQRLSAVRREKQQIEERQSELKRMSLAATHATDMIAACP